jgi:translation initiation factor 1
MRKVKQREPIGPSSSLRQPLSGLAGLRDRLTAAPTAPVDAAGAANGGAAPTPAGQSALFARAARIVVRRERKGHGGKTATRIEGLAGSAAELDAAVREIKRALGCGATLDGGDVVVQGAQGERLVAFLTARGARKVTVGS